MTPEFKPFDKMARLNREVVVTEKIDGTNGQVLIEQGGEYPVAGEELDKTILAKRFDGGLWQYLRAGSRTLWLTRETDNKGFAKWAQENATDLFGLGIGKHFGEWWGSGIGRGYGLPKGEKRFSLFNTGRWMDPHTPDRHKACIHPQMWAPDCCYVVPVLGRFPFMAGGCIDECLFVLQRLGSAAAPGFTDPEGIVIYHTAANKYFKVTLENDAKPKSTVPLTYPVAYGDAS